MEEALESFVIWQLAKEAELYPDIWDYDEERRKSKTNFFMISSK